MGFFTATLEKKKVVFIMGPTGTGKSKLSVEIAAKFEGEIINSDKMQVYKGLDIVTNKLTKSDQQGIKHHLLSKFDPHSDFSARDFCFHAITAIKRIVRSGRVPIVVGGSNSFVEELVESSFFNFRSRFDCCFIWLDVSLPILYSFVSKRVDRMVDSGLVNEVREIFDPEADYSKGIRRSIGVPEMDKYFRAEKKLDEENKEKLLGEAIEEIKENTCTLISNQLEKIHRLKNERQWAMYRIDSTRVFEKSGEAAETAWWELVFRPSSEIIGDFLK